jgi:oxalate decarboxylase/phosphoglucose isomerase-like protein (cupin superfamily)
VYAAEGNSRTFDYQTGDVGYIPHGMSHYIENTGNEDVVMLEVIQGKKFQGEFQKLSPARYSKCD